MNNVSMSVCDSNPISYKSLVITSSFSPGIVSACKKSDGSVVWQTRLDSYGNPLTLYQGSLYTHSSRTIYALDPETGAIIWQFRPGSGSGEDVYSHPTPTNTQLFFGDRKGFLYCLERKSGRMLWKTQIAGGNDVNGTAVVVKNLVITTTNNATAVAVNRADGTIKWETAIGSNSTKKLAIFGRSVLISASSIVLIEPRSGKITQQIKCADMTSAPLILGNKAYVINTTITQYALARGEQRSLPELVEISLNGRVKRKKLRYARPAGVSWGRESNSLFLLQYGGLTALDPRTLKARYRLTKPDLYIFDHPLESGRYLFATLHFGQLICYKNPALK
jgi:PQQ-like domain